MQSRHRFLLVVACITVVYSDYRFDRLGGAGGEDTTE
jgi:hypothetical protein